MTGYDETPLSLGLRIRLRWWGFLRWFHRCPDCARHGYDPKTPRWDEDKTARAMGWVTPDRCPGCGRAALDPVTPTEAGEGT